MLCISNRLSWCHIDATWFSFDISPRGGLTSAIVQLLLTALQTESHLGKLFTPIEPKCSPIKMRIETHLMGRQLLTIADYRRLSPHPVENKRLAHEFYYSFSHPSPLYLHTLSFLSVGYLHHRPLLLPPSDHPCDPVCPEDLRR